jgi:hypothetical protein
LGVEFGQEPGLPPGGERVGERHLLGIDTGLAFKERRAGRRQHLVGLPGDRMGERGRVPAEGARRQQIQPQVAAIHPLPGRMHPTIGAQLEVAATGFDSRRATGDGEQDRVEGILRRLGWLVQPRRADVPGQPRLEEPGLFLRVGIGGQVEGHQGFFRIGVGGAIEIGGENPIWGSDGHRRSLLGEFNGSRRAPPAPGTPGAGHTMEA